MKYRFLIFIVFITVLEGHQLFAADRFPENIMETVVAIGLKDSTGTWVYRGTGFVMWNYQSSHFFLVTNKHVLTQINDSGKLISYDKIFVRANAKDVEHNNDNDNYDDSWVEIPLNLKSGITSLWTGHQDPKVDIAVLYFPPPGELGNIALRLLDVKAIPKSYCGYFDSISVGQEVLFFGFPLGLGLERNPDPIARAGMVAQLDRGSRLFYIDGQVFSGSSGSPVVVTGQSKGDEPLKKGRALVGIVSGFISTQLHMEKAKIKSRDKLGVQMFIPMENSGLGVVYSIDLILEVIEEHNKRFLDMLKNTR